MPKNISTRRTQTRDAVVSCILSTVLRFVASAFLLYCTQRYPYPVLQAILLALVALTLCPVVALPFTLRHRIQEIERGELDEARKY